MAVGQRYSVMIKLDQTVGEYYLRFASYPWGDMQQVMEGKLLCLTMWAFTNSHAFSILY